MNPQGQPVQSWWNKHWWAGVGLALFVILVVLFVAVSRSAGAGAKAAADATGLLALIAAAAIGIERAIEGFWTVMGQLKHAWWPLNEMAARVTKLEGDVNATLETVYASVEGAIRASGAADDEINKELAQFPAQLAEMRKRIGELQGLAMGNQRVNLIAATALQNVAMLEKKYPDLRGKVEVANQAIAGLTDFAASFRDNPARRVFSLFAGAILGLIVAWVMRLDIFLAVFGSVPQAKLLPYVGVALTGLLIGLGSGPTHDVVAVLQEVKKLRASQNQPGPVTGEVTAAVEGEDGGRGFGAAGRGMVRRFR